ncbi:hypothetical protein AVEN_43507-1 [Araneus ventricosus]|uniref:Uncharacterized protein n=1 Tax=Araneus ventricosus TaxID=182803 RepID=A0A4Y2F6L8_ARAVE|nr:hypothetical protein AVEN_43507-1 [Araneus ventricosus]
MKIGVGAKGWNSNEVGFPFSPFGDKNEIRFFEAGDKSPLCGGRVGEGKCVWGLRLDWRNQDGKRRVLSPKSEIHPCGSRGPIMHSGASLNDPPDRLESVENKQVFGQNGIDWTTREYPA